MEYVIIFFLNIVTGYLCLSDQGIYRLPLCSYAMIPPRQHLFRFFFFFFFWNNVLMYI